MTRIKSVNPLLVFWEETWGRLIWTKDNFNYPIVFMLFCFFSTASMWLVGVINDKPIIDGFNTKNIIIYTAPMLFTILMDFGLKVLSGNNYTKESGAKSVYVVCMLLFFVWLLIWIPALKGDLSKFNSYSFFSLVSILFFVFVFNSKNVLYEDQVKVTAPSNADEEPDKDLLNE